MDNYDLQGLLKLQIRRKFLNITKDYLSLFETNHNYIKRLEKLLLDAGFENFKESQFDYQKDRNYLLGRGNDAVRDLECQLELFDVNFKKKE